MGVVSKVTQDQGVTKPGFRRVFSLLVPWAHQFSRRESREQSENAADWVLASAVLEEVTLDCGI